MKSVALTIRFVHQAEIPQLWRDETEAREFCLDPEMQKYKPRLYLKDSASHSWVRADISPAEF